MPDLSTFNQPLVISDANGQPAIPVPLVLPPVRAGSREAASIPSVDALQQLQAVLADDDEFLIPASPPYPLPPGFRLSVVIPVYNERATIVKLLARVRALPIPLQIIVVDDCSTDGTADILHIFAGLEPFRMVFKSQNEGKGSALRAGFAQATGTVVIVQDADLEYDPRDILAVIEPIVTGTADVVYGSRFLRETGTGSSGIHRLGNRILTWVSNLTTGLPITDMETCYKAFRRDVLAGLSLRQDRFGFEPEVTAKIARRGHRIQEVPVRYRARNWQEGKKIGWRDGCNALFCIARYAFKD